MASSRLGVVPGVLAVILLLTTSCGGGPKRSDPDDLGLARISETLFSECVENGRGPNLRGGTCDDGVTETKRFLGRMKGYHLSSADRDDLLTEAANDADPYCGVCADMIDRTR
jgi:hypothetical protein